MMRVPEQKKSRQKYIYLDHTRKIYSENSLQASNTFSYDLDDLGSNYSPFFHFCIKSGTGTITCNSQYDNILYGETAVFEHELYKVFNIDTGEPPFKGFYNIKLCEALIIQAV